MAQPCYLSVLLTLIFSGWVCGGWLPSSPCPRLLANSFDQESLSLPPADTPPSSLVPPLHLEAEALGGGEAEDSASPSHT